MADQIDLKAALDGDHDLAQRDLKSADLSGVDFSGRNFEGALLKQSNFSNASLRGATLTQAKTMNLVGVGLDCSEMSAQSTVFFGCKFHDAKFTNANLSRSHFRKTDFSRADLRGANFANCVFNDGNTFDGAVSDVETRFDGATILHKLARSEVFRYYQVERGKLVRRSNEGDISFTEVKTDTSINDTLRAIEDAKNSLVRVADIADLNSSPAPGIGHNRPPLDSALSKGEIAQSLSALDDLKLQLMTGSLDKTAASEKSEILKRANSKIVFWLSDKADIFSSEFVKTAGQELGKTKTWVAGWLMASGQLSIVIEKILGFLT